MASHFSIIVPAYNEEAWLPRSLAALRTAMDAAGRPGEMIVVDNASDDRTVEIARSAGARVVSEPVRQISRARNAGGRQAAGAVLIFVDADTLVPPLLIKRVLDEVDAGAAGGGSVIRFPEGAPRSARLAIAGWNRISRALRLAAGSFLFCRREAFEAAGGFSEAVYASEEIWFSKAVKKWGRRNGLAFRILSDDPVLTSSRKADWYGPWKLFGWTLFLILVPFAVRFRTLCAFWYNRPPRSSP